MNGKNGDKVVERLVYLKRSLEASLQSVSEEMRHRTQDEEYRETYLSELRELLHEAQKLQDRIRNSLNYG